MKEIKNSGANSIAICPINFKLFEKANKQTGSIEATLLLSKIRFHHKHSIITKRGLRCLVRSRAEIAEWFGFGIKKTDRLLASLERMGLIIKFSGLWYGRKKLFISVKDQNVSAVPINMQLLNAIMNKTGSIKETIIYSKIAFALANTKIEHDGKLWCCQAKKTLSEWSGYSIRTIDLIIKNLQKKGLLIKNKFCWNTRLQTHFHIPGFIIKVLSKQTSACDTKGQNCRPQPAKKTTSIRIRTKIQKTNNIEPTKLPTATHCDINFVNGEKGLNNVQLNYIKSAIVRTSERKNLKINNLNELLEEVKFSVLLKLKKKTVSNFKHAVNHDMKILADSQWKTPIGFHKYSEQGALIKLRRDKAEKEWNKLKQHEIDTSKNSSLSQKLISSCSYNANSEAVLTEKAMLLARSIARSYHHTMVDTQCNSFTRTMIQIEKLISLGADGSRVANLLRSL